MNIFVVTGTGTPEQPSLRAESGVSTGKNLNRETRPLGVLLGGLVGGENGTASSKCDGAQPICGPCLEARKPDDCEYTNGQKRARAEILQEDISRIESRIYELEHPQQQSRVRLQQPYRPGPGRSSTLRPPQWAIADEPPMDVAEKLIDSFLPYASEFGFFLNTSRFRQTALIQYPIGHPARPSPALLSTVYLWGLRLSKQSQLITQEPLFLSRALKLMGKGLSGIHPQKIMHTLQAEILIAYYFFASGRFLEGKYHTAAAVSLAPRDAVEEGERIYACWSTMVLDKAWAIALSENPHQNQDCVVDTPWPLESDDYEKGGLSPTARYSSTFHRFIGGVPTSDIGMSTVAMLSKATILWQRAEHLTRDWKPDMTETESAAFQRAFTALDGLIDNFRAALVPPNGITNPTPAMTRTLVVAHSIAHTATIQLHGLGPLRADANSKTKCLDAARTVLNIVVSIPLQHFAYINPIMGTVWQAAFKMLLEEICAIRVQRNGIETAELTALLAETLNVVVSNFAGTCPLLNYQITQLREAFSNMQS
ncbi:hypothetical protein C8R43DRAFT_1111972 [Mycena crocata]|nr:hypothetical protein C8R43DRAFT_1111972 [Mycena crocata]